MHKGMQAALGALKSSLSNLESDLITSRGLNEIDSAAGYRLILGIEKWIMDRHFLGGDTQRPRFIKFMDEFSQWGLGNPDNGYWSAQIDSTTKYRISGERSNFVDICIEMRSGIGRRETGEHSRTLAYLDAESLVVGPDGRYVVTVGEENLGPNHLPAHPEAEVILVRQTFADWDAERPGQLAIERIGNSLPPPLPPGADEIARLIEDAARRLEFVARINDEQVEEFKRPLKTNVFSSPKAGLTDVKSKSGFFPGQHNALALWALEAGKALIITLTPPDCRYLGFMIGHPIWFSALDFANRQNSLNTRQAHVGSDNLLHYIIAAEDPAVPNWIDPGHLREGFMFFRCQGLQGSFDVPTVRVVDAGTIRDVLPGNTPVITQAERWQSLAQRRSAVHKRFL